ncbi:hypothetical protein FRB99_003334, partial [Tulasnella sp. 403]
MPNPVFSTLLVSFTPTAVVPREVDAHRDLYVTGKMKTSNVPVRTGGFCDVYKGKHRTLGEVALKHIKPRVPLHKDQTAR